MYSRFVVSSHYTICVIALQQSDRHTNLGVKCQDLDLTWMLMMALAELTSKLPSRSLAMPSFQPDKSLLNAKFEGYKLDAIEQDAVLSRLKLEHPLRQSSTAGKSPLTFHEVQSRIRHNHLTVGPDGSAVYIDSELRVVRIVANDVSD